MDRYQQLAHSPVGRAVLPRVGVPSPPLLRRHEPGRPLLPGPVLIGAAPGGRVLDRVRDVLKNAGAEVAERPGDRPAGLVFDATGIHRSEDLVELHAFFAPVVRALAGNGRVVVIGTPPELAGRRGGAWTESGPRRSRASGRGKTPSNAPADGERSIRTALAGDARAVAAQRALEGFTRSLGKEVGGRGSAVQLVQVAPGAEDRIDSTLRFLLSARSAFVSGQVIRIGADVAGACDAAGPERPLDGRVVVVTGASRGIGAAIARTLARDGATVAGVDVPPLADELSAVMREVGGTCLLLDVTAVDAAPRIARHVREHHGRLDGIVHNAGITRDRKLANLTEDAWRQVVAVNLTAPEKITAGLLEDGVLGEGGRVVVISSVAGIAGNTGQTNYAASKAGLIGMVAALAPELAPRGVTINAVAPGFIETQMTAKIPLAIREGGRRLSAMLQGGQPADVAEAIGWYLSPGSTGVTGNVVRVCGQALIGA